MSLHHCEENLALKLPVTTDKDGLRLFHLKVLHIGYKQLKLITILTWGTINQRYYDLLLLKLMSNSSASLKYGKYITRTERNSL